MDLLIVGLVYLLGSLPHVSSEGPSHTLPISVLGILCESTNSSVSFPVPPPPTCALPNGTVPEVLNFNLYSFNTNSSLAHPGILITQLKVRTSCTTYFFGGEEKTVESSIIVPFPESIESWPDSVHPVINNFRSSGNVPVSDSIIYDCTWTGTWKRSSTIFQVRSVYIEYDQDGKIVSPFRLDRCSEMGCRVGSGQVLVTNPSYKYDACDLRHEGSFSGVKRSLDDGRVQVSCPKRQEVYTVDPKATIQCQAKTIWRGNSGYLIEPLESTRTPTSSTPSPSEPTTSDPDHTKTVRSGRSTRPMGTYRRRVERDVELSSVQWGLNSLADMTTDQLRELEREVCEEREKDYWRAVKVLEIDPSEMGNYFTGGRCTIASISGGLITCRKCGNKSRYQLANPMICYGSRCRLVDETKWLESSTGRVFDSRNLSALFPNSFVAEIDEGIWVDVLTGQVIKGSHKNDAHDKAINISRLVVHSETRHPGMIGLSEVSIVRGEDVEENRFTFSGLMGSIGKSISGLFDWISETLSKVLMVIGGGIVGILAIAYAMKRMSSANDSDGKSSGLGALQDRLLRR